MHVHLQDGEKKLGRGGIIYRGKAVSAPPSRATVKFLRIFLPGEGDLEGGSG